MSTAMSTDAPPRVGNPYVGPTSFRLGDPLYGRDREEEDLLDLLIAERIVLLYSPSGAGKTSLIQAALVPALQEAGFEVLPVIRVTHALRPRPGMPTPRNRYVLGTLLSLEEGVPADRQRPVEELATLTLRQYMEAYADRDQRPGNEVLVFDQFEEVLTADPTDEAAKHQFFAELGEMLRDRGHWALFSMREDFLAALDPYLRHVPTRFRTTFRLDLLAVPEALDAIRLPARTAGVDFTEDAANQLVDDLRRVRVQRPSGVTEDAYGSYVEPVQLQVACRLLWSTLPPGADRITRADVEALGDVDRALGDYYADRVATIASETGVRESVIRDWFEDRLITPQGLRGQVLEGPEVPGQAGRTLLGRLVDAHLVRAESRRQATWYELAHDRLVEPVRRDNSAWRAQHMTSFERAARLWAEEGRPDRLLLLGGDLAAAERDAAVLAGALKAREHDFLEASRRADEQVHRDQRTAAVLRRSTRRLRIAVALMSVLALVAGSLLLRAVRVQNEAQRQGLLSRLQEGAIRAFPFDQDLAVTLAGKAGGTFKDGDLDAETRDVLYQAATASPVTSVLRGHGPATTADWSSDGSTIVTGGIQGLQTWDRTSGTLRHRLSLDDAADITNVDASADASTVVAGFVNGSILVWDVASGRTKRWRAGGGSVWSVVLSPDGRRIASVDEDTTTVVWSLDGHRELSVEEPYAAGVWSAAFTADGGRMMTLSTPKPGGVSDVTVWDARSGLEIQRLQLADGGVAGSLLLGPDAATLATIGFDNSVGIWDARTGQVIHVLGMERDAVTRALNDDFSQILTVEPWGQVVVQDAATGKQVAQASAPGAGLTAAGFASEPGQVFVLSQDGDPAFWRTRASAEAGSVSTAAVGAGAILLAWSDGTLRTWNLGGRETMIPNVDWGRLYELSAMRGGRLAVGVTASDGTAHVWNTKTGAAQATVLPKGAPVWDAVLTPDGTELITGDSTGRVRRWDSRTGAELGDLMSDHSNWPIGKVAVAPDGSHVLAAPSLDISATVSDDPVPMAQVLTVGGDADPLDLKLPTTEAHVRFAAPEVVTAAEFSPDSTQVVVGTSSGRVAAFDTGTGKLVKVRRPHIGKVLEVTIGPRGDVLSTGSDRTVAIFGPGLRRQRGQITSDSDLRAAAFSADGRHVGLVSAVGAVASVPMDDRALIGLVRSKVTRDLTSAECARYGMAEGC
jgi:WD40 repeat protein